MPRLMRVLGFICLFIASMFGQDSSTGAIRVHVVDPAGQAMTRARVEVVSPATGLVRSAVETDTGTFTAAGLQPGDYEVRADAQGLATAAARLHVDVGGEAEVTLVLKIGRTQESVTVQEQPMTVETQASAISSVIDERAIDGLPLNGRRFTDLALLSPGVAQDPRGLTSAANGDLAFGGLRGFHTSFTVDGVDNNNSMFAQARGRYRAPYQFSNEVVQEFRVSTNTYGVEQGRSGSAVVNVVTKSGGNVTHGSLFYYLRDSRFNAQQAFMPFKPSDKQHQFGATLSGKIKKNRAFWYVGFDQQIFHVPTVVRFANGSSQVVPTTDDYEASDKDLVFAAAQRLSQMAGTFRSSLLGNTGFGKLDWTITPKHHATARLSTSRYWGENNVYFDPASPLTTYAISENGEERVRTESGVITLMSELAPRVTSNLRAQFSHDLQDSIPNSAETRVRVADWINAFGRSSIMPRQTNEHKLHVAETAGYEGRTHRWKFGADTALTYIRNFFPMLYGGQYIFDNIRVNPFTFEPQVRGLYLTPLRAYAHGVPRYYTQNFGDAVSHPDTQEYAFFVQDAIRVTGHLALTLGVRYDLQILRSFEGQNPAWPEAGTMPRDTNNIAPRIGFAYTLGTARPVVIRGGYGIFYTRIPQIYNSSVEVENGINRGHLFLDNADQNDHRLFPAYPAPLASCGLSDAECVPPASVAGKLTSDVSAFARDFQTPYVNQGSLSVEHDIGNRVAIGATYMFTHGVHLIRARDVNLPEPTIKRYPVFDETGTNFTGDYFDLYSFAPWVTTRTTECAYPPCLGTLTRPVPQYGAIDLFESAASNTYHALTVSIRRRMTRGLYFRAAYTWAKAIDDGQDALVAGRPATVQNSYSTSSERGLSSTDQRQRFVASWIAEPRPFHRDHPILKLLFNDWKLSSVVTFGSGRPVDARTSGDANLDGNSSNDRLPGYRRNAFTGPNYFTADMRLTRLLRLSDTVMLEAVAESFNIFNRINKRVQISDDGFLNTAGDFVAYDKVIGSSHYPAHFRKSGRFLVPKDAYAPRQVQFALKLRF